MSGRRRGWVEWDLLGCVLGHHTYAPDEPELRAHLHVPTPAGPAWRCLRCGSYVPGEPRGHGPAEEAPAPRRGQLLRDAILLRLLALDRFAKALVVLLAAYGVWELRMHHDAAARAFERDLPLLQPLADQVGWRLADSSLVHAIRTVVEARTETLGWMIAALVLFSGIQLAEGVGLWLLRRWGEYVAAVATALFIPIEIYELLERVTWLRVAALVINIGAVGFIGYRKRLFGLRGGRAAAEAERHEDNLLQVAQAAARVADPR